MAISDDQYLAWLQADNVSRCLLVEATYYSGGTESKVYISNGVFISQGTDTPEHMPYDDSVLSIPAFQSQLSEALQGFTVPSWGNIEISNELFDKDIWLTYAWDGRAVTLLFGDPSWARADFRAVITGTIASISAPSSSVINLAIRDKQWTLNVPLQTSLIGEPVLVSGNTYKVSDSAVTSIDYVWDNGNTVVFTPDAPNGRFTLTVPAVGRITAQYTDGENNEGQVVPDCFGECFNITPVLINKSLLKYQVHGGAIEAITEVRDSGVPVAFTADLAKGTFVLTKANFGEITADVKGAKPAGVYLTKAGAIIDYIVTERTRLSSSDIDVTSLSNFNTTCPQTIGIYTKDRTNTLDFIDQIITSVGGWYTFNRAGKLIFGRVENPEGTPKAYIVPDDIVFKQLRLQSISIPQATAKIGYKKNNTVQTQTAGSVASGVYEIENLTAIRNNDIIKATHLLAVEPDTKLTNIVSRADALTEVSRLLTLYGTIRKVYQADCVLTPATINVGDIVHLTHLRYSLSGGKLLIVIGISESLTTRRVTLTLWG